MGHHRRQGIIPRRQLTAGVEAGVHPNPGTAGEVEKFHRSRTGAEIRRRVLRIDAALYGGPVICTASWVTERGRPDAIRSCSRTKSTPLTISVMPCST